MANTDFHLPPLHLNGSGKKNLVNDRCDAIRALGDAINAMRLMSPHGRDYYTEEGSYEKAREQHMDRMERVAAVISELEAETQKIADGPDEWGV
jgi:hypothetical protein